MEAKMRAFCMVLTVLLIASVAVAGEKDKLSDVGVAPTSRALDCTGATPIACGQTLPGDNTGMPNNVVNYSCSPYLSENGGEVVYEFVVPTGLCYEVTVTMVPSGCDLDVFFLGSCNELECLYYSAGVATETIETGCLEPGTYYIVVDGYGSSVPGAECPFDITVDCVECECPVPPCCPFENTVYLVDFNLDDGGYWLLPCGGVPTWEWGAMTNPEVPDIACDDVPVTNILATTLAGDYPGGAGEIAAVGPFFIDQYCTCLELCHFYDTEARYDGCNIKVSTDDGTTWTLLVPSRGYDQALNSSNACIPDEEAFTGHQFDTAFLRDCFDITDYVGMEITVGFFFGSDSSVNYPGWYIKWVKIGSDDSSPVEDSSWGNIKALYR
jgi:hypothetical protein